MKTFTLTQVARDLFAKEVRELTLKETLHCLDVISSIIA